MMMSGGEDKEDIRITEVTGKDLSQIENCRKECAS